MKIYHAGDTNVFGDMAIIRELYAPEIVMLPIGDHYTMGPQGEAAYACNLSSSQEDGDSHAFRNVPDTESDGRASYSSWHRA